MQWWREQDEDDRWVQQMLEDEEHEYINEQEMKQIKHLCDAFDKIFGGKDA